MQLGSWLDVVVANDRAISDAAHEIDPDSMRQRVKAVAIASAHACTSEILYVIYLSSGKALGRRSREGL